MATLFFAGVSSAAENWQEMSLENAGLFFLPPDWKVLRCDVQPLPIKESPEALTFYVQKSLDAVSPGDGGITLSIVTLWFDEVPLSIAGLSEKYLEDAVMNLNGSKFGRGSEVKLELLGKTPIDKRLLESLVFTYQVSDPNTNERKRVKHIPLLHEGRMPVLICTYAPKDEAMIETLMRHMVTLWQIFPAPIRADGF